MNFLHLSAADHGGAGTAAWRLHDGLRAQQHGSRMIVLDRRTRDEEVVEVPGSYHPFRAVRLAYKLALKALAKPDHSFQNQQLSPHFLPEMLLRMAGGPMPDVLVVHFISNFISMTDVQALHMATGAPVVWHLLDMAMLTGGCHYAWSCVGYRASCGHCPALRIRHGRDWSARIWREKSAALAGVPGTVVAGSSILAQQARASSLFSGRRIETVLLSVPPDRFALRDRLAERQAFGLPELRPVVFFGAQKLNHRRKGMAQLLNSLQLLRGYWPVDQPPPIVLSAGDTVHSSGLKDLGLDHHDLGFVDAATLARAYAAADVFACPSLEDSGPMMINEALMCGTPVVAFRMGVAPDLIEPGITGEIVELGNVESFARALADVLLWDSERKTLARERCRTLALERCAPSVQVRRFIEIARALRDFSTSPDPSRAAITRC